VAEAAPQRLEHEAAQFLAGGDGEVRVLGNIRLAEEIRHFAI
jgi:hypothetical protein